MMSDYERDLRLLRPANTPDGRDAIELQLSQREEYRNVRGKENDDETK